MEKILYYSDSREFGGAEAYLAGLVSGLDKNKYEPVCVFVKSSNSRRIDAMLPGIKTYKLSKPEIFSGIASIIRKEKPDIVHLNMHVPFSCFFMLFILKIKKINNILATVHSTVPPRSKYPFLRALKGFLCHVLFSAVKQFICVSKKSKAEFCQNYGIPESRVVVVYNGIAPSDVISPDTKTKHNLGIDQDSRVVGMVSRVVKDKGHEILVKAATKILKNDKNVTFLIVGSGPLLGKIKSMVKKLGIYGSFIFFGDRNDIYELISIMDIAVLPSFHETFGLVILEYMMMAKPVVASAVGGIPEIIEHNKTGLLVPVGDEASLASSIEALLHDKDRAAKMGVLGRKKADSIFSLDKMIKNTQDVYDLLKLTAHFS